MAKPIGSQTTTQAAERPQSLSPPSQPEALQIPLDASSPNSGPAHIDAILEANLGQDFGAGAPVVAPKITKEQFVQSFTGAFRGAHKLTGLKSLDIPPQDEPGAQACAEAMYESILDIPMLHWILDPSGKWMGRAMAIGFFVVPMAGSVSRELAERRRPAARPGAPRPAPKPPGEGDPSADQVAALNGV